MRVAHFLCIAELRLGKPGIAVLLLLHEKLLEARGHRGRLLGMDGCEG